MTVGVAGTERRNGIEVEQALERIGITIVLVGQAIVRVRHGRARRGLARAGMRKDCSARRAPSGFRRRDAEQQDHSERDPC